MRIYCSDEHSHSSAPESNKQNPRDRTLDLSIFFRYKHIPSLKNLPSPAPNESSAYWFQGNSAASFTFNFCLREFLLSAFANRFELRCEPKRLMLLYYKICPCSSFRTSRRLKHAISQRKKRKRWKKVLHTNHNEVTFHFIDNYTNPGLVL